jgi:hypothetical protein
MAAAFVSLRSSRLVPTLTIMSMIMKMIIVKEYFSPTQGGARFALLVRFRTTEKIGPRTKTLVAGSLQYL